jgi:hypothetical protein
VKEAYNNSLHPPPDASVTALAFATAAPDAGACELKRYLALELIA